MNTFRGEVATIILGFRYEITETETFGNDASLNEDGVGGYECAGSFADDVCVISQSSSSKHEFFAPNFTYKLQLDDNLVLRAARWSALSRPKFTAVNLGLDRALHLAARSTRLSSSCSL